MKILMICTEKLPVPPVLGGAIQTYIFGLLPILGKYHEITVLGVSDPLLPDKETKDGIQYVRVPGKVFEVYREEVIHYVESHSFDLIHIYNRPRLVMPIRSAAPKSKIILSMHNDMFNLDKIDPNEANAVIKEVSAIVTVSNYVGNVIRKLYPEASPKIRTIYSGVDTDRFLPGKFPEMQKIRNEIRQKHGLEDKTVMLFAGRLSDNKGVDRLVRALPQLSKKFKNLALVIVGSKWFSQNDITAYIAYVKALAKRQPVPVVATGFVPPDEIQNWFAAADLFVCTSIWQEPLARVHYEAMAAGLPIVTTERGGNPEVISSGENGLIVENPEDPSCFADKITEILSDKSLMRKMGKKGRELAVYNFKWDRVAKEILEVWEHSMQMLPDNVSQETYKEIKDEKGNGKKKSGNKEGRDSSSYRRHRDSRDNRRHRDSWDYRRHRDSRDDRRHRHSRDDRRHRHSRDDRRHPDTRDYRSHRHSRDDRRHPDTRDYHSHRHSRDDRRHPDTRDYHSHRHSRDDRRHPDTRDYRSHRHSRDDRRHPDTRDYRSHRYSRDDRRHPDTRDYRRHRYSRDDRRHPDTRDYRRHRYSRDDRRHLDTRDYCRYRRHRDSWKRNR
ncbi:lipopolysaccharide N-acetylglucosaminyltransferase [Neobacillus massiliamazoniensis]|uniref:Lipopolysaccharide N-acetylglucosaminyltransferase n=1 Tax=Neobacillus massiliamazoniensis TaxID=1499688 RepID=A0A0U1NTY0_9BACI|nr:lipopolysaccharide N-acetylglucosaminyltransferase [Neobacillus massiliamazoniensis]